MDRTTRGIVRGKTIELAEDLGTADGDQVEVIVRVAHGGKSWGDGIRRSAGGWVDYPEIDAALEEIRAERQADRGTAVPE